MANLTADRDRVPKSYDAYGPYTTTYNREFWGNAGQAAQADRPASTCTQALQARYQLSGPIGNSNYAADYFKKPMPMPEISFRNGKWIGNKRNNPHPSHVFMMWRLSGGQVYKEPPSASDVALNNETMNKILKGKLKSTYQSDFMGGKQKISHDSSENISEVNHHYSLASQMRQSYQIPEQLSLLKGNTVRYGCNKHKNIPVNGVVPAVSTRPTNVKTRTTYDRDYADIMKTPGTRDIGKNFATCRNTDSIDVSRPVARLGYHPSPNPSMITPWVSPCRLRKQHLY